MGYENSEEILHTFPVLDKYPLKNVAIHARIGKQLYKGEVNLEAFQKCINLAKHKLYYNGDITTYQITAPIQGGNSGGPLFDDKGNFIGINSSKLKSDFAENVAYSIKSSYVLNLIDVLPKSIDLPSNTKLQSLPLTEQIKEISKYVVLVKVK